MLRIWNFIYVHIHIYIYIHRDGFGKGRSHNLLLCPRTFSYIFKNNKIHTCEPLPADG